MKTILKILLPKLASRKLILALIGIALNVLSFNVPPEIVEQVTQLIMAAIAAFTIEDTAKAIKGSK